MNGRTAVLEIAYSLRDFLFPPSCPSCGGMLPGDDIVCSDCIDEFTGEALNYDTPHRTMEHAAEISVLLPYNSSCRTIVHALKYNGMPSLGLVFGRLMAMKLLKKSNLPGNTILIPVPLHPARLKERGYNQSESLAAGFASFSQHDVRSGLLKRTRKTGTQTALGHEERAENVRNAFVYSGEKTLAGCDVILIDDVLTTGSTMSACVEALKSGGAGNITVSVLATPDMGSE